VALQGGSCWRDHGWSLSPRPDCGDRHGREKPALACDRFVAVCRICALDYASRYALRITL
jgi:hypothetical protein